MFAFRCERRQHEIPPLHILWLGFGSHFPKAFGNILFRIREPHGVGPGACSFVGSLYAIQAIRRCKHAFQSAIHICFNRFSFFNLPRAFDDSGRWSLHCFQSRTNTPSNVTRPICVAVRGHFAIWNRTTSASDGTKQFHASYVPCLILGFEFISSSPVPPRASLDFIPSPPRLPCVSLDFIPSPSLLPRVSLDFVATRLPRCDRSDGD